MGRLNRSFHIISSETDIVLASRFNINGVRRLEDTFLDSCDAGRLNIFSRGEFHISKVGAV